MSLKAVGITDYENEALAQTALATLRSQSLLTVESVVRKVADTPPPLLDLQVATLLCSVLTVHQPSLTMAFPLLARLSSRTQ